MITDKLPAGLTRDRDQRPRTKPTNARSRPLQCTFTGTLYPYERLTVTIKVKVEEPPGTVTTLPNEVSVEGGGAPQARPAPSS